MSAKVAVLKPVSSAISIGTGGPFGAEGPIIMTGGAIGSLFAQAFHLSAADAVPLHPDDTTGHAIDVMVATDRGRLLVTDPVTGTLLGLVTRKDLLQVRAAVTRAEHDRQAFLRARPKRLDAVEPA